ncbi:diaminopropionate ammonia-lyase [Marinicauda algicola]|uniref:Diaminopropionate ammonia-lyase n=1 Tax=Marinicauda algicola TaxID=2029849 RepID=A0A4S2GW30_9PROT|nr:diaminopropionate ammonia-lyase [Marinicauda algicola]TGY87214.1 diaminopropionate ammonia-lyase [Marinicauda algicola]
MALLLNETRVAPEKWPDLLTARFGLEAVGDPRRMLQACPVHAETGLIELAGLAGELGIKRIWWKDERSRMRLNSFKALGGAYAVARQLERRMTQALKSAPEPEALIGGAASAIAQDITVTCATDGNHGLSVAAGAHVFGMRCVIFVHARVPDWRIRRIEAKGAEVRVVDGVFDDAVAKAEEMAQSQGWILVADTSPRAEDEIAGDVIQGYSQLADEIHRQLEEESAAPSHLFVQSGVGGLAAAVIAGMAARRGEDAPFSVCVDPARAPALYESFRAGKAVRSPDRGGTVMEMLDCYAPSALAWEALKRSAHAFMTVEDDTTRRAVELLAEGRGDDPAIEATETAAAGLGALIEALEDEEMRERCGLDGSSEVVLIGTEAPRRS